MRILWRAFSVQKHGNKPEENEDAIWPPLLKRRSFETNNFSCALADGATQTSFSSLWAQALVREVGKNDRRIGGRKIRNGVRDAQKKWSRIVNSYSLPWHAEEKVRQGAFSTFLHLSIKGAENVHQGVWRALAVGDTCLFHINGTKYKSTYPVTHSTEFNNKPVLISSIEKNNIDIWNNISSRYLNGYWFYGDDILLMTDALAFWFLYQIEKNNNPISIFKDAKLDIAKDNSRFVELIQTLRLQREIRNDDTSLIWLTLCLNKDHQT